MKHKKASISVVIPVKNEGKNIQKCIEGILSQSIAVLEIIVIDSGSTDDTLSILKNYPEVKVIEINSKSFNHGLTRNLGVNHAQGDFVLFTVGDAGAFNEHWIEELFKSFDQSDVAGVCGQQVVPHEPNKNPVEYFRPQSSPKKIKFQFKTEKAFNDLEPYQKKEACGWDDVNAMYRRDILLKIPFQQTNYSEDAIWAKEALLDGYALVYNDASRVYHYHFVDEDYTYKRTFTTSYYNYKYFGYVPSIPQYSLRSWLSMIKIILFEKKIKYSKKWFWFNYNVKSIQAMQKAIRDFNTKLNQSEVALDRYHEEICDVPPIPLRF